MFKSILKPFASLRLTVTLLALSMIVVFAGTWAQIDDGIWQVQRRFFHSFFCIIDFNIFLPRTPPDLSAYPRAIASITEFLISFLSKIRLPMLGGYSLMILLLVNLLAAHTVRFKLSAKRTGIILLHAGLILLICGEVITSVFAVESQMVIQEGETVNFASDIRTVELAVIDPSAPDHNKVVSIPKKMLYSQADISHPDLPFDVHVDKFFANSGVLGPFQAKGRESEALATTGTGVGIVPVEIAQFSGTEADRIDQPSAFVTLTHNGQKLGTYLLSIMRLEAPMPSIDEPQAVKVGGKTYWIQLRFKRYYKPYSVELLKFRFDRFTGTNTPRNYSSDVRIIDPEQGADRDVRIWMNHPLRYRGETFYQSDFNHATEHGTVLSVVHNPGWLIPYISCSMVALGMVIHFGLTLLAFFRKRSAEASKAIAKPQAGNKPSREPVQIVPQPRPSLWFPGIATACCVIYLLSTASPDKQTDKFDLVNFGRVPVSYEGRVMPLDSLARNSLKIISGKSDLEVDGKKQPASWWLLNTMAKPDAAAEFPVVRIDLAEILSNLKLDTNRMRFSVKEIMDHRDVLEKQANLAMQVDARKRDLYQRKILELVEHLNLFFQLAQTDDLYLAPPLKSNQQWKTVSVSLEETKKNPASANPGVRAVLDMLSAYHDEDAQTFNSVATEYTNWTDVREPETMSRVNFELIFNHAQPFINAMALYILIFLLVCFSWMFWGPTLQRTAFWLLIVTLIFHTLGLAARIYIQGRPPVTNLYSSAIFIAWGVGVMCVGLELIYRNSIGTMTASLMGFLSLLIAQNLSGSGDTMQMMQAVLDTNFWLATHVVVITLGYAATFLAGFLAIAYVVSGLLTKNMHGEGGKQLYRMVYGIVCFAMLFSFVGTILGGIWADQSWGRFWGWDPKENGAVLIVFWNALILHSRWGGLVKARGMMLLAIFGNVVTAWSWFGTNMLGVGLHSYGFMDSAVFWLVSFMLVQLGLIGLGSLPLSVWRSFRAEHQSKPGGFPVGAGATA